MSILFLGACAIPCTSFAAKLGPVRYVLRGTGSGSLGEQSFESQPFVLDMEGLVRHLGSGFDAGRLGPSVHPGLTWFRQAPLSRLVMRIGGLVAVVLNAKDHQLLAINGRDVGAAAELRVHASVSFCTTGLSLTDCQDMAFLKLWLLGPIEFGHQDHRVRVEACGSLDVPTTHGILRLRKLEDIVLEILVPEPQPPFYAAF